ncbi:NAD-dependent epimerase/dehydratase family protein [Thiohalorhabdus methylotrophus]|uniref:NAD-dependent epimerase/dehydratase family protein n=1 Tax=Thiohalorhabdus methylotrophus TaxID=3242694 RepID=A0ABV4TWU4_9GAMM
MRILVTGANSHLAQPLLPRLLERPGVEEVIGLDWFPLTFPHPRFRSVRSDIRAPELREHLEGVDAVVHLAFIVMGASLGRRWKERNLMRSINLEGSRNLFSAAREAGVRHVVYPSSAAVYGAWPDNPVPMDEESPRRPMPGFGYSEDKAAVEFWLDSFEREPDAPVVTRLRMHAVVGPDSQPLLNRIARTRLYIRAAEPPPVQCLWENDAVDAILRALATRAPGAFNIAGAKPEPLPDLIERHHRRAWGLPYGPAAAAHRLVWRFSSGFGDPGWLAGLRYPLVLDCSRAARTLNWRPNYSVANCIDLCWGEPFPTDPGGEAEA